MRINIWKDPKEEKYYFALVHEDAVLSGVMAKFFGNPDTIQLLIEIIKKGSEL